MLQYGGSCTMRPPASKGPLCQCLSSTLASNAIPVSPGSKGHFTCRSFYIMKTWTKPLASQYGHKRPAAYEPSLPPLSISNTTAIRFTVTISEIRNAMQKRLMRRMITIFWKIISFLQFNYMKFSYVLYQYLYNNPSYSRILIGSCLWSIRGQTHDCRHHQLLCE